MSFSCFRFIRAFAVVFVCVAQVDALNLQLTPSDIDRALTNARQRESERARFHAPYVTTFSGPFVERIEIVTEFRRVVLLAEDHILKGDRGFAYSTRLAQEAVRPWNRRVSLIARIRFHPQNNYITVPPVEVAVDGPNVDTAFVGVLRDPLYALSDQPGAPLAGAVVEAVFDANVIGQTQRTVTVRLDAKALAAARLDFRALE
jgi:hypothetical protein